ncbi:hypothetical protein D9M69_529640 [compost metagenome]
MRAGGREGHGSSFRSKASMWPPSWRPGSRSKPRHGETFRKRPRQRSTGCWSEARRPTICYGCGFRQECASPQRRWSDWRVRLHSLQMSRSFTATKIISTPAACVLPPSSSQPGMSHSLARDGFPWKAPFFAWPPSPMAFLCKALPPPKLFSRWLRCRPE